LLFQQIFFMHTSRNSTVLVPAIFLKKSEMNKQDAFSTAVLRDLVVLILFYHLIQSF
jgi:hypothetical protein